MSWMWALADSACLYLPETFAEAKGAERSTVGEAGAEGGGRQRTDSFIYPFACYAREFESEIDTRSLQLPPEGTPFKGLERAIYSVVRTLFGQSDPVDPGGATFA